MAGKGSSIFNQTAQQRLSSPDDLDKYLRVTTPKVWVALLAIMALAMGLLAWGFFGSVSSNVTTTGTCVDGMTFCLLDGSQIASVNCGDAAYIYGQQGSVASVSEVPISRDEARTLLKSDYLVDTLMQFDWAYLVTFDDVEVIAEGVPVEVSITTERVAPISLVLG